MINLEIKVGTSTLEITNYEDGDIEINICRDISGWLDGGQAATSIILGPEQTQQLLNFLKSKLELLTGEEE